MDTVRFDLLSDTGGKYRA